MKNLKIFPLLLCILLLNIHTVLAQKEPNGKNKADKLYEALGYMASVPLYEGGTIDIDAMVKIANSYRLNNNTFQAEKWYAQVVQYSNDPMHSFYYAQASQSNGNLEKAKEFYLKYDELAGDENEEKRGSKLAAMIDDGSQFSPLDVKLKNVSEINTDQMEFSPAYFQNGIVFVSDRGKIKKAINRKDIWTDGYFMSLYHTSKDEDGSLKTPEEFSHQLTTDFHEGPVAFSKDGNTIYFTRSNINKGLRKRNKNGKMKLKIFTADKKENGWEAATELPFSTDGHEECHPAISANGLELYFSSDRPGGHGGMDLYVAHFKDGQWSEPQNLGDTINTPNNEVFPFIHEDGTLYFASNGHGGMGGLDIFSSTSIDSVSWHPVENIGAPFNSLKDDFGFILNLFGTEGYLTSSREGGQGKDDIYHFELPANWKQQQKEGKENKAEAIVCITDEFGVSPLENVKVTVKASKTNESADEDYVVKLTPTENEEAFYLSMKKQKGPELLNQEFMTDSSGKFTIEIYKGQDYEVISSKSGFQKTSELFETEEVDFSKPVEWCMAMEESECIPLEGTVNNEEYGNSIPNATVTLFNLCDGETETTLSDKNGHYEFTCLPCDCEFVVTIEKDNFYRDEQKVSTLDMECQEVKPIQLESAIQNSFDELLSQLSEKGGVLEAGVTLELKNIFYDFNEYVIRYDAMDDLNQVAAMMKAYPSMIIELSSHTDSRGSEEYNLKLSQKRADAAISYLMAKGIDHRRLYAMGYGETRLRNLCEDDVRCTEAEHQFNRRTEIKVLHLDNDEVQVQYIDNVPEVIDRKD